MEKTYFNPPPHPRKLSTALLLKPSPIRHLTLTTALCSLLLLNIFFNHPLCHFLYSSLSWESPETMYSHFLVLRGPITTIQIFHFRDIHLGFTSGSAKRFQRVSSVHNHINRKPTTLPVIYHHLLSHIM